MVFAALFFGIGSTLAAEPHGQKMDVVVLLVFAVGRYPIAHSRVGKASSRLCQPLSHLLDPKD